MLYTIRSERQLIEQIDYNLLYRWFVGLELDDEVFSATVFTKNRERLLQGEIAQHFFEAVLAQAESEGLVSSEHFTVDGTLIEAWASQKSFVRKDEKRKDDDDPGNPTVNFRGEKRSNQTHASTTDPDARLAGMKGQGARLAYQGYVVTENRNGLVVAAKLTQASGYAEREAALEMVQGLGGARRITLGGDKGYDAKSFVQALRTWSVTPHVAQNTTNRRSAIDRRTTGHPGYEVSQRFRKRVEEVFGWMKTVGLMRRDPTPGHGSGRLGLHLHRRGLQPGPHPQPVGGDVAHDPARSPAATRNRFVPGTAIPHSARHASRRRRPAQHSHFLRSLLGAADGGCMSLSDGTIEKIALQFAVAHRAAQRPARADARDPRRRGPDSAARPRRGNRRGGAGRDARGAARVGHEMPEPIVDEFLQPILAHLHAND